MELNALTRWESIGKDLYAKGQLGQEIERIKHFSHLLAAARQQHRQDKQQRRAEEEENEAEEKKTPYVVRVDSSDTPAPLSGIVEEARDADEGEGEDEEGSHRGFSATSSLPLLYPDASTPEEERIQDEMEKKELDEIPVHHRRLLFFVYRASRRFGKGFAVGYVGKLLFGLVSSLLRSRGHLGLLWQHSKPLFFRADVTGYGLFLGGFLAVFESLMRLLKRYKEQFGPRRVRVAVSAAVAGLCFLFIPREYRVSLAMFFFVRALEIVGSYVVEHGWAPPVPHADTLLMASASAAVIWCWLFHRSALEPSYAHFLDMQGAKPRWMQQAYATCHYGNAALFAAHPIVDVLQQQRAKVGLPPVHPASTQLRCDVLHPGQSHVGHMLTFLKEGILRALPVYVPVYVLPLLVFRMKDIVRSPLRALSLTSLGIFRSSLFLSAYCTACWFTSCMVTTQLHSTSNVNGLIAGWVGGCMVLIEKKSRRIELALYVLAQAIPAVYRYLHDRFHLPFIPHAEAAVFVASIAVIMAAYILTPHLLRRSYLSLLMFFFGSGGRTAGFHTQKQLDSPLLSSGHLKELEEAERRREQMKEADEDEGSTDVQLTNGKGEVVDASQQFIPVHKKAQ